MDVSGLTSGVTALAAGWDHTCAITAVGGVKCWGANESGQLGDGTTTQRTTPVDVSGLVSGVTTVSAGYYHTCVVLNAAGGVKCWGANGSGQLGDGTTTQRTTPVDVNSLASGVTALAAGYTYTCAVLDAVGGVKCWGANEFGQLGDGTTAQRSSPMEVSGLASGVTALAAGSDHICALLDAVHGGGVKCWGQNDSGQLGDGTTTARNTPVNVSGLASSITALAAGCDHTCAVTNAAGGVKCWGWNKSGQLGDGTTTDRNTPVNVRGLVSGVTALAAGGSHACALIDTVGGVKCWGQNESGQLGDGTTTQRSTPTTIALSPPPTTATSVLTITSFTISPLRVYAGDPVTLTWTTIGAESASLYRLDDHGRFADAGTPVSTTGSLRYDLPSGERVYTFGLFATAGEAWVRATVNADAICTTAWFFADPPAGCPTEPRSTPMIAERFERGLMIWTKSLGATAGSVIYILYNDTPSPRWDAKPDAWSAGMPESDPGSVPPTGRYQPVRGFGLVWRDTSAAEGARVRDRLGWAIEPEFELADAAYQCDGQSYHTCYLSGPDHQIYVLLPEKSGWSVWPGPTPIP